MSSNAPYYPNFQTWEEASRYMLKALTDHKDAIAALKLQADGNNAATSAQISGLNLDTLPLGTQFGKVSTLALTENNVDLTKTGTIGPLPSLKSAAGLQLNSTNYATVDSFDAGASATARIYGTGGPGTSWTRQVGADTQGPFPSGTITGLSYNTIYQVLFDGAQFYAYTTLPPGLSDSMMYVGTLTTVPSSGGAAATADAIMGGTGATQYVTQVNVTNGGSGYTSAPSVTFNAGGTPSTIATGYATISGGSVTGVVITNSGAGYSSAPTVTFSGGQSGTTGGGGSSGGTGGSGGGRYNTL